MPAVTVDDLGVPTDGRYFLLLRVYISSGPRREGDVLSQAKAMGLESACVPIDPKIKGVLHDITKRPVAAALIRA
eukprot:2020515-Prymnesium_polylepis.1